MSATAPTPATPLFAPRVGVGLTLVGVLAFAALAVFATFARGPDPTGDGGRGGGVLSPSAVGFSALSKLLVRVNVPTGWSTGVAPAPANSGPPGLLILTPPPGADARAIARIHARMPVLIVLPKWATARDPNHRGWVRREGVLPAAFVATPLQAGALRAVTRHADSDRAELRGVQFPFAPSARFALGRVEALQSATPQAGDVLLADDAGRAVLFVLDHTTYVLTDPDLLDNLGLRTLPRAGLALTILDALRDGGPVIFDTTLNTTAAPRSLLRLALTPPFLGATLCAAAAACLAGWRAAVRFGAPAPAARAIALGKTSLVDNTAVLIRLARREPGMAPRYAALTRRLLARAIAPGGEVSVSGLDGWLDRLPGASPPFSTLVAEADRVRDEAQLMAVARRLYRRRREITLERL